MATSLTKLLGSSSKRMQEAPRESLLTAEKRRIDDLFSKYDAAQGYTVDVRQPWSGAVPVGSKVKPSVLRIDPFLGLDDTRPGAGVYTAPVFKDQPQDQRTFRDLSGSTTFRDITNREDSRSRPGLTWLEKFVSPKNAEYRAGVQAMFTPEPMIPGSRLAAGAVPGSAPTQPAPVGGSLVEAFRSRADLLSSPTQIQADPTQAEPVGVQTNPSMTPERAAAFARLGESPLTGTGPGTRTFNENNRGLKRVASLLRRSARAYARGDQQKGQSFEKAAGVTSQALGAGMGTSLMGEGQADRNFQTMTRAGYETGARLSNPIIPGQEQPGAAEGGARIQPQRRPFF